MSMEKKKITLSLAGGQDFLTQEAYKTFRTNIQFCGKDLQVIGLTSHSENEGKTTVTLGIAKSFAELGKRTLVVDADMRKSVMAGRNTDAETGRGLSEVLTGFATWDECVNPTDCEGLDILFAGKYPPNPVELLNSPDFAATLQELRKQYDYIFVDTPPLGQVIDASVIATQCDGMILVIGNTKIGYVQERNTVEQLRRSGSRILGVVRNHLEQRSKGYYRSKKYGYRAYGYGYGAYGGTERVKKQKENRS